MNKTITLENGSYELTYNYKNAFQFQELEEKWTDFFYDYDYIIGDYAYDKLRLKGFCEEANPKCNSINKKEFMDSYIQEDCAYACRYFILKKVSKN